MPCCDNGGRFSGSKKPLKMTRATVARLIFLLYSLLAVWRVTVEYREALYWLLLLTLLPFTIEMIFVLLLRKDNLLKGVQMSVLFYLFCSVPSLWLLELRLLEERNTEASPKLIENIAGLSSYNAESVSPSFFLSASTESSVKPSPNGFFARFPLSGFNKSSGNELGLQNNNQVLKDELQLKIEELFLGKDWTLALEQMIIFAIVLARWIAPKGELTRDEISQLLLVYIASGADIIELMELFNDERVRAKSEVVFIIMSAWTWSLLQFTIVPLKSSTKSPEKNSPTCELVEAALADHRNACVCVIAKTNAVESGTYLTRNNKAKENTNPDYIFEVDETSLASESEQRKVRIDYSHDPNGKRASEVSDIMLASPTSPTTPKTPVNETKENEGRRLFKKEQKVHSDQEEKNKNAVESSSSCCNFGRFLEYFHTYNEIWIMAASIIFLDGPFFVIRMLILIYYQVITHQNIFFTCKNLFVILLLINRFRVIVTKEKENKLKEEINHKKHDNDTRYKSES